MYLYMIEAFIFVPILRGYKFFHLILNHSNMALGNRTVLNPFQPLIKQLPQGFRNRVFIILAVFILWMLFFDKASLVTQIQLSQTVRKLNNDKIYYQNKIKEVEQQRLDIENNPEKFARERYFMKAPDEDVFVIDKQE